ncbi:hypothetical protein Pla108_15100 [Botrimarina colliarenosi]|uniref:DUF4160 domain-containing protein n=1 Tax=Botrimarina colliarenosi TaxID=2528001 RepID=A0A5C6AM45_9BACT|nr:DUF4160 domain-containing protein [Botrimarina colliarenosi]TWU00558.1 hypothetical protein Pla108_15100 [Botrimarina colliarenosi]
MPVISRFYGIAVKMYYNDHAPPHFHATYSGNEAVIEIETSALLRGGLPNRALDLIVEWVELHRDELRANWDRARHAESLDAIDPLP